MTEDQAVRSGTQAKALVASLIGSAIEWYDFFLHVIFTAVLSVTCVLLVRETKGSELRAQ